MSLPFVPDIGGECCLCYLRGTMVVAVSDPGEIIETGGNLKVVFDYAEIYFAVGADAGLA